jgi:DNA-binding MarR family transcriptional regulator
MSNDIASLMRAWVASPHYTEMTARQMSLLAIICDEPGPHHVRHLAAQMKVSKPVITRIGSTLAFAGYLQRRHDHDARNCILEPTTKGRELRAAMAEVGA